MNAIIEILPIVQKWLITSIGTSSAKDQELFNKHIITYAALCLQKMAEILKTQAKTSPQIKLCADFCNEFYQELTNYDNWNNGKSKIPLKAKKNIMPLMVGNSYYCR